jgi:anti-anti-sigma factor
MVSLSGTLLRDERLIMPTDAAVPPGTLSVTVQSDGTVSHLFAAGEIDMSTSGKFRDCLKMALDPRPKTLIVDLAGVSFMDSTGIAALVYAHTHATEDAARPTTLTVINCQPAVQRVLDVTGLLPVLTNSDGPPHPR